jgi:hypothetical protein
MQCISTARGTACFWKDFGGISNFSGVGEYETEQYKVVITKDGKVPPPKSLEKEEEPPDFGGGEEPNWR